jgi:hypothetical protein
MSKASRYRALAAAVEPFAAGVEAHRHNEPARQALIGALMALAKSRGEREFLFGALVGRLSAADLRNFALSMENIAAVKDAAGKEPGSRCP